MKEKINNLLFKMQSGENCIGETSNQLLELFNKKNNDSEYPKEMLVWNDDEENAVKRQVDGIFKERYMVLMQSQFYTRFKNAKDIEPTTTKLIKEFTEYLMKKYNKEELRLIIKSHKNN